MKRTPFLIILALFIWMFSVNASTDTGFHAEKKGEPAGSIISDENIAEQQV